MEVQPLRDRQDVTFLAGAEQVVGGGEEDGEGVDSIEFLGLVWLEVGDAVADHHLALAGVCAYPVAIHGSHATNSAPPRLNGRQLKDTEPQTCWRWRLFDPSSALSPSQTTKNTSSRRGCAAR